MDLRFDLEEGKQVVEVQRLSRHLREPDEQALQQLAQPAETARKEGQVADGEVARHRSPCDIGIGDVVTQRAQRCEQGAPERAPPGQLAIGDEEFVGQLAEAGDEEAVEVEDLHLLRRLHARAHLADVFELAPLRSPLEVQRVTERVEVRLADERRQQRHRQQHDQPWCVDQQACGEADHRDDVLHLAEQLAHQVHAPHRLATRAVELVLQVRVLEILQVERGRVLHQTHAGRVGEQFGQQRIAVTDQSAQQVRRDRQHELHGKQPQQVVELSVLPCCGDRFVRDARADQAHGFVDDQLADIQRGDRQERADEPQSQCRQRQRRTGRPDLFQERRQVAQRVEAVAQTGLSGGAGRSRVMGGSHRRIVPVRCNGRVNGGPVDPVAGSPMR